MFRTDLPSIIRSLNTAYTAIGIYHASYVGESKIIHIVGICFAVGYTAGWA
jgi:hypothetical protein